ncbi:MAG TPA: SRPBCC domain-containing protein [Acidimicrobiia bacterium]|jgi:uncharacterized protein YndB with AHSA1/START domain
MRVTRRPITPVRKVRLIPLPPDEAFDLFTIRMGTWWPLATHSIAQDEATGIRIEGHIGGQVVELTQSGQEYPWGEILAWDPPHRFVMSWHPRIDPEAAAIVEVTFREVDDGTELTLEHRGWEEFGDDEGVRLRDQYEPGWDFVLSHFEAELTRYN